MNPLQILHILFIFFMITVLRPSSLLLDFTPFGTAVVNHKSINLTQHFNNSLANPPYSNFGRVFYKHPIQFLDSSFDTTVSFSTRFSFTITPPPPPFLSGEGIAFLITSDSTSFPHSIGSIGLPAPHVQNSFLAVEFDTNFDHDLGDINDNHVGIDFDSIVSVASVDLTTNGIDLKSGKRITAWIEYRNPERVIRIWVGYTKTKPLNPILVAPIDLSNKFNRFMHVGFSAANQRGSAIHSIDSWYFKTYDSVSSNIQIEDVGSENCSICYPEDPARKQRASYLLLFVIFETLIELYRLTFETMRDFYMLRIFRRR